jgi:hypothetical protein
MEPQVDCALRRDNNNGAHEAHEISHRATEQTIDLGGPKFEPK